MSQYRRGCRIQTLAIFKLIFWQNRTLYLVWCVFSSFGAVIEHDDFVRTIWKKISQSYFSASKTMTRDRWAHWYAWNPHVLKKHQRSSRNTRSGYQVLFCQKSNSKMANVLILQPRWYWSNSLYYIFRRIHRSCKQTNSKPEESSYK